MVDDKYFSLEYVMVEIFNYKQLVYNKQLPEDYNWNANIPITEILN